MPSSKRVEEDTPPGPADDAEAADLPALTIPPEKVCFVIFKAREFDA